ncbi:MAG: 50S ribosomal protein L17 [Patescibacteria group bacterium]
MKHLRKGRKLHREKGQRSALLKTLTTALFINGKIKTTEARAKELRPFAERVISCGKENSIAKKRLIAALVSPKIVKRVFEVAGTMEGRNGGYTRIIKMGPRKSDGAKMAIIELMK